MNVNVVFSDSVSESAVTSTSTNAPTTGTSLVTAVSPSTVVTATLPATLDVPTDWIPDPPPPTN